MFYKYLILFILSTTYSLYSLCIDSSDHYDIASYGFNESEGDVLYDNTGKYNGVIVYEPTLGVDGVCGYKQINTTGKYSYVQQIDEFQNINKFTITGIYSLDNIYGNNYLYENAGLEFFNQLWVFTYDSKLYVYIGSNWTLCLCEAPIDSCGIENGVPFMISVVFDGTLNDNSKLKVIINAKTINMYVDDILPASLTLDACWYIGAIDGSTDELWFSKEAKSESYLYYLYNKIF